jgi:hypothetical protein
MTRHWRNSPWSAPVAGALMAVVVMASGAVAPRAWAAEFTQAELFFELNDTDGDLGIHASIDGGPYVRLEIEDPQGRTILVVTAQGRLAKQGLTQLSFESAEPPFDELPAAQFFRRFPEGVYEIEAVTSDGKEIEATVRLSHVLAAPPSRIRVAGQRAAENCDDVDNFPSVRAGMPVLIDWDPVTRSHPTIGKAGRVEIVRYQLFVEQGAFKLGLDLPPDVTEFVVPAVLAPGSVKFEIIARTTTGNNTAVESCFEVTGP